MTPRLPVRRTLGRLLRSAEARIGIAAFATALVFVSIDAAAAHEFKIGAIEIGHPWSRATPPGAKVGGGYVTITNEGDTPDRLVAATFEGSASAEIHEMAVKDGVMTMRELADGLPIPAHETVTLAPSGLHLMFVGLKAPLVQGTEVKGTLTFEKAGTVEVAFAVDAIGAKPKAEDHDAMPGMKM